MILLQKEIQKKLVQQEYKKNMAENNYIPEYVSSDLKWYKRDGLLTYIDQ